jgi:hypothetical protein
MYKIELSHKAVTPWTRVLILLVSLGAAGLISLRLTGSVLPDNPPDALIFQNALLLVVLGSAILEYHFTKPADSLVNSLTGIITLVTVYSIAPRTAWWGVFLYCTVILALATVCIAISSGKHTSGWRRSVARITYEISVFFGRARLLYSILFLFGVLAFYGLQSVQTITLMLFWGFFIAIWPLGLPELFSGLRKVESGSTPIGQVIRTDWPNIVRVDIDPATEWTYESPKIFQRVDGTQSLVIPLYTQLQGDRLVGTGLCVKARDERLQGLDDGHLYDATNADPISDTEISEALGGGVASKLVGFVIEESTIPEIRFETWDADACREGMLVWCHIGSDRVYYQITNGATREESFQTNRHGFQIAVATQIGILDDRRGFLKYTWVPLMNTPVFAEAEDFGSNLNIVHANDFIYGNLPGSQIQVGGPFTEYMDYHTAILGVTGSGKTELALDILRHAVEQGIKVVCIDLTAQYEKRLTDLSPVSLSLSPEVSSELSAKLFEAETGPYGAGAEKRALKAFTESLRADVSKSIKDFLTSTDENARVGIITLEEISNTKATLFITELYLTCLLHFARDNPNTCPRILIAVEEAHTVMPEPGTMGLGDYDSRGLVSKIAQIALQGRKYGVGLLVIAQRTATVSKSVLTQCNTVVSFNCFDDTSLKFLDNVYGASHVSLIPNLPPLHAVIFGKGLRSERPLIVAIPFDEQKANRGD